LQNELGASDPLSQLLSQIGDLSGEEAENMDGMIEQILGAIMSKDVLYDPMKELSIAVHILPVNPFWSC
jgi:peroxin-19